MTTIHDAIRTMGLEMDALRAKMTAIAVAAQADGLGDKLVTIPKSGKAKAPKAEKKERANAGLPTLHGDWTRHVLAEHGTKSAEFLAWRDERAAKARAGELFFNAEQAMVKSGKAKAGDPMSEADAVRAAHIPWVTHWQTAHPDAYAEFKSAWEVANPKEGRVASAKASQASGSDAEDGEDGSKPAPKKRGAKKMADMTPEEKAIAQAKRAANKAAKAAKKASSEEEEADEFAMETVVSTKAPSAAVGGGGSVAPAAAPEAEEEMLEAEEESEETLMPFINKKISYLRLGHLDKDGDPVWWEGGDIWLQNADGSKGAYAGQIQASGKIDASPAVMAAEPEIC